MSETEDGFINRCGAKNCYLHNNRGLLPNRHVIWSAFHYCSRCGSGGADHIVSQCPNPRNDKDAVTLNGDYRVTQNFKTGEIRFEKKTIN